MYGQYYHPQPPLSLRLPSGQTYHQHLQRYQPQQQQQHPHPHTQYAPISQAHNYGYFPPSFPVHPPPLPMDPANPKFSSRSPLYKAPHRKSRIESRSPQPPPKAKLGGPTGRPYTPSPADSSPRGEWRGRQINVKIPVEPYKTTWDLKVQEWTRLMDAREAGMGPECVPLPLSPMEKGSTWPCRNEAAHESEQLVNGISSETVDTVDSAEVEDVSRFGMVKGGRLKVVIPDNTAWLRLIQDAADRLSNEQLQADRLVFGEGDAVEPGTFSLPPAPRLKPIRSLSDRALLHPSPTRPKFAFRGLTDYVRRLSVDDSPALSPLVLPGVRQEVKETPTKQLSVTAVGQLRDDIKPISASFLSVAATPFIPRGPAKVRTPPIFKSPTPPRQPSLSRSAAAYLPPWVETNFLQEERVYPSVSRVEPLSASHVATNVLRAQTQTMGPQQSGDTTHAARGHGDRFQSQDSLRWFTPVEAGPDADEFEYEMDSRSASEFSNPSDEDEYLRRRLASRLRPSSKQRQWSSSSPCQSSDSADSFGVQKRAKRRTERDREWPVSDEANERSKARVRPEIRSGRSKQVHMTTSPAATVSYNSTPGSTSLNPDARPFQFGGPHAFTFHSPLPTQKLITSEVVTRPPRVEASRQTLTPTDTFVTADGSPLRTARALQAELIECDSHLLGTLAEDGADRSIRQPRTSTNNTQGVHRAADDVGCNSQSNLATPHSAPSALEPQAFSGQSSSTSKWTPEKNGVDKELQQDIMRKWRYPVSPERATPPSIMQTLIDGEDLKVAAISPSPGSDIARRARRPIPSFEAPSGEALERLHLPSQDLLGAADGKMSTHTSVDFPMRSPPSSLVVRNASPAAPSASGTIASCSEVSLELLVKAHVGLQDDIQEGQLDVLKGTIADCIQSSIVDALTKVETAARPVQIQRIEQFMERIADVLEQQSRLLLGATQEPHAAEDEYPNVKTHTEELLSALVAGQHTLLDQVGTMHDLRELLDGAPAAISKAAETLDAAQDALFSQSALQAELNATRHSHLDAQVEVNQQLAKARAAHGQARSELEMSLEQIRVLKAEKDDLRQQLSARSAEQTTLQQARLQAEEEARATLAARRADQQTLSDLRIELGEGRRLLDERQTVLQRVQKECLVKDVITEDMAGTIRSLAEQCSKQADQSTAFKEEVSSSFQIMESSLREQWASSMVSPISELSDLRSKLHDAEVELSTLRGEHVVLKDHYAKMRTVTESQASDLRAQLKSAQTDSRQAHELLQAALLEQAKFEGKMEACIARETALREQYSALRKWASDCRRALERSETLRCQPFIIHDVHTGDYAEVVTPLNRREYKHPMAGSASTDPSRAQEATASSNTPLTPPRHGKHATLAAATSIMTPPPTIVSKNRKASAEEEASLNRQQINT